MVVDSWMINIVDSTGQDGCKDFKISEDRLKERDKQDAITEQFVPVELFIMLYKVILTFESVDAILMCDHSS